MEQFKAYDQITNADRRWSYFALFNPRTGESRVITLKDHYERVADFDLHSAVPEAIRSHFNTAKNILLYAWFAYRFFAVAEMHVLSTLEFALRERLGEEGLHDFKARKKRLGLHGYIAHAIERGWIRNEDFSAYRRGRQAKARQDYLIRKVEEMKAKELDSIRVDYSEAEIGPENATDFLGSLQEVVSRVRNDYAHGTSTLYPTSTWFAFEICGDFINRLFDGGAATRPVKPRTSV